MDGENGENGFEEARQRRLNEMKKRYAEQQAAQQEALAEMQIDALMRQALSPEAKARLGNVKLVNRELYLRAVQAIVQFYRSGHVQGKLGDVQLKELLEKLSEKRETMIRRK